LLVFTCLPPPRVFLSFSHPPLFSVILPFHEKVYCCLSDFAAVLFGLLNGHRPFVSGPFCELFFSCLYYCNASLFHREGSQPPENTNFFPICPKFSPVFFLSRYLETSLRPSFRVLEIRPLAQPSLWTPDLLCKILVPAPFQIRLFFSFLTALFARLSPTDLASDLTRFPTMYLPPHASRLYFPPHPLTSVSSSLPSSF